ncbi:MAG: NAD-glutamate dehydrogenase, partial [Tetrasphaera sp.]|nr:NAD-glutamate dehydrogenase [Tetrasphaera sp.]
MTEQTTMTSRESILERIAESYEKLGGGGDAADFVGRFYRHVATDELRSRSAATLAGVAAAHRELAEVRQPGTANVRVFNPTTDVDGWSSARTVVQIVTDDMPFLVDSVTNAIVGQDLDIHLLVHPQLVVSRDAAGRLESVEHAEPGQGVRVDAVGRINESWMLLTIDRETDEQTLADLETTIRGVLTDVRESVEDWPKMRTRCLVIAAELEGTPPVGLDADEVRRATTFLRWMADNHFTFLGYRDYVLKDLGEGEAVVPVTGTGLGLLRSDPPMGQEPDVLTPWARELAHEKKALVITKANSRSTVHRMTYLDYVGVRQFDEAGEVIGERRFLGLYASTAYTDSVTRIPLVADKVEEVIRRSGVAADSHTGKDLLGVLETFPRDELFQSSTDELFDTAMAITQLQERRRTKLFLREDDFRRFVSALVYIPRDRYNTSVRTRMADLLKETFGGESVEFTARVSESALSRLQFVVRMPLGERVRHLTAAEQHRLEERLVAVSRTWSDRLGDALRERLGEVEGNRLVDSFARGFPTAYEETFTTSQGVADLAHLDRLSSGQGTSVALYRPSDASPDVRRFKLFRADALSLTDVLPIFTHMGVEVVDEQPYEVTRVDGTPLEVYDFGLRVKDATTWESLSHEGLRDLFEGAVLAVWEGEAESDGFNRLVLGAHLTWRQVVILRSIAKYLRQTQTAFSQHYFE